MLINGTFSGGLDNWLRWPAWRATRGQRPSLNIESSDPPQLASPAAIYQGTKSARLYGESFCFWDGIYQVVSVAVGSALRLRVTGKAWAATAEFANQFPKHHDTNVAAAITAGLDAQGGTDALIDGVRWAKAPAATDGAKNIDQIEYPIWVTAEITAVAQAPSITVFAGMDLGGQSQNPPVVQWEDARTVGFIGLVELVVTPPESTLPASGAPAGAGILTLHFGDQSLRLPAEWEPR